MGDVSEIDYSEQRVSAAEAAEALAAKGGSSSSGTHTANDDASSSSVGDSPNPTARLSRSLKNPSMNSMRSLRNGADPEHPGNQGTDSMDAPTLMAAQAREAAAAFEKARQQQDKGRRLTSETSLQPRHFLQEMKELQQFYRSDWTPDRGTDAFQMARRKLKKPALVGTGRAQGASRVQYTSTQVLTWHMWHRDLFLTTIHQNIWKLLGFFSLVYLVSFFFFSLLWWAIWKTDENCLYGIRGYIMAFNFSIVTQQTIGYGNSGPNNCAKASLVLVVQTIFGLLLDAITIGVLFARISHPQQRARSIFVSESAVIARRDGILKLMFRIADIKTTQVVEPKVRAYLFTWGDGRHTAEGEFIPVRSEELDLGNIDGLLLLPITIEHTIDERSPLCGHTFDSLEALNAEVVVTFEGTTETGNPFMSRQSYLAHEIRWGYQFVRCIHRPQMGATHYTVDTAKFHQIEPQPDLPLLQQSELSQLVVSRAKRTVPYPILGENTLVLSDSMVLTEDNGELSLMFRVGDTYPSQILEPVVRMYIYRWPDETKRPVQDYKVMELDVGYDTGADRLMLWLPVVVKHKITSHSPLASWTNMKGFLADADSFIAVVVEGFMYSNSQNRMRMRVYNCFNDIRLHHHFATMVSSPLNTPDHKPRIDWSRFHSTTMDDMPDGQPDKVGRLAEPTANGGRSGGRAARRSMKSGLSSTGSQSPNLSDADAEANADAERDTMPRRSIPPPSPAHDELTSATFEGSTLTSLLPHLDHQSTFNRRDAHSLHRRRLPPEAYYEGSSRDFRRSQTLPTRRQSDTQRAALPEQWQRPSAVPEDSNV